MMLDISAANTGFVAAAYGLTFVVLLALIIVILLKAKVARNQDKEP